MEYSATKLSDSHLMENSSIIFQVQSALILSLLFYGVTLPKKNRLKHRKIMVSAIIWDLILILQIEFSRGAINKASKVLSNPWLLNYHVAIAVSCVIGYFILLYTGHQIMKKNTQFKMSHKVVAYTTLLFRVSTFITSFII